MACVVSARPPNIRIDNPPRCGVESDEPALPQTRLRTSAEKALLATTEESVEFLRA